MSVSFLTQSRRTKRRKEIRANHRITPTGAPHVVAFYGHDGPYTTEIGSRLYGVRPAAPHRGIRFRRRRTTEAERPRAAPPTGSRHGMCSWQRALSPAYVRGTTNALHKAPVISESGMHLGHYPPSGSRGTRCRQTTRSPAFLRLPEGRSPGRVLRGRRR